MNYYNEFEPKAAAWLRELAAAGQIAPGTVDHRSITDIQPHELHGHTQHHFFAGIAGWAHALDLAGWSRDRPVWTASLPCQPFSAAGQGRGASDERHLWPVFFRIVREHRPQCIFGEQVAQAIGFDWLDGISADLEAEGYAVGAHVLGAHSVGAPHRRQRLYWMAYAAGGQRQQRLRPQGHELQRPADDGANGGLADSERQRLEGHTGNGDDRHEPGRERADEAGSTAEGGGICRMADTTSWNPSAEREQRSGIDGLRAEDGRADRTPGDGERASEAVGDPESRGRGERGHAACPTDGGHTERTGGAGFEGMDDATGSRREPAKRWTEGETRDEARMRVSGAGRTAGFWSDFTIIPCRDGKSRRIESGTFPLVARLPKGMVYSSDPSVPINAKATAEARVMRLRGYGNAIVPELAAEFIRAAMEAIG